MELELGSKVAIVTGGSKDIGRATALGLVAERAAVLVCARPASPRRSGRGGGSRRRTSHRSIRRVDILVNDAILIGHAGSVRSGESLNGKGKSEFL